MAPYEEKKNFFNNKHLMPSNGMEQLLSEMKYALNQIEFPEEHEEEEEDDYSVGFERINSNVILISCRE